MARVCGLDTPFPLVFEPFYMPTKNKVSCCVSLITKHFPFDYRGHYHLYGHGVLFNSLVQILDAIKSTVNY